MAFTERLVKLKDEEKLLLEKKKKIVETRKAEIGRLAEKLGLLEISNSIIAGALLVLKNADAESLERFENEGGRFLPKPKPRKKSHPVDSNSAETA